MQRGLEISAIIPALNEEYTIEKSVGGLKDESGTEVIVSDGGSTDGTVSMAERSAKVVRSMPGRGLQMNAGARAAEGDILLFLHADTALPEGWKEKILSAMSDKRVAGGAFGLSIDSRRASLKLIAASANLRSRLAGMPYGDQGIFVRRSIFEEVGGFREIPIMEDVDFIRRLKKRGKVVLLKERVKTSARRWEKEGVVFTTLRNWLLMALYFLGVPPERLYRFYRAIR